MNDPLSELARKIRSKKLNKEEIENLKKALVEENNKLKSSQVDTIKQLSIKDSIIDSNKQEISRLLTKKSAFETEDENNKKTIKELNYKIIELNQKIESNETMNKISKKIKKKEIIIIKDKKLIDFQNQIIILIKDLKLIIQIIAKRRKLK